MISALDLAREAWMRARVNAAGEQRVAAVIGAFHAPALLATGPPDEPVSLEAAAPAVAPPRTGGGW